AYGPRVSTEAWSEAGRGAGPPPRGAEATCWRWPWGRVAGEAAGDCATFLSSSALSSTLSFDEPDQLATTRPVTRAVVMMRAIPIAVSFQGFIGGPPFCRGSSWETHHGLPPSGLQQGCQTPQERLVRIRAELCDRAIVVARLGVTCATECCSLYSTGRRPPGA